MDGDSIFNKRNPRCNTRINSRPHENRSLITKRLDIVIVIVKIDVPWPPLIPFDEFSIVRRAFIFIICRQHAL